MKTLYFECLTGVSGDMILASLIDAGSKFEVLNNELSKLKLDFEIKIIEKKISGIKTKQLEIIENKSQPMRKKADIENIINKSALDENIKNRSIEILNILGQAEAKVHGTSIENIHFHEIGAIDTIVDIVGSVILIENINAKNIICSKINLGSGFVEIEHGRLPVPAPASSEIAKDMKTFSTDSGMELATPTGLAILKYFVNKFGEMPESEIKSIGYGAGTKSNDKNPNMLRAFILEETEPNAGDDNKYTHEIHANIDDCSAEILGYTMEKLFEAEALDVYFTPIQMKKQRPGTKLSVICNKKDSEKLINIILKETTTKGVRIDETLRKKLEEKIEEIRLYNHTIKIKLGFLNEHLVNISPEYEDCKVIALKENLPVKIIIDLAKEEAKNSISKKHTQGNENYENH